MFKCPFHPSIPDLIKQVGLNGVNQYLTNPSKVDVGRQGTLYKIPFIGKKLGNIYGEVSSSTIQVLENQDACDALDYIRHDVHERKKSGTDKAVCPFENAFFLSNGYGYKIYTITQENLSKVLEKSVQEYNNFAQMINNTKNSLLCVILDCDYNDPKMITHLERELIRMKNDVYTAQGYMGGFVASQTLAGAARVSHVGAEQDVQTLEKGPFEKNGKPMVMTRQAHYGSKDLIKKNLFTDEKTSYTEKMAINFGDYGSYRNPIQILNGINVHITKENLDTSQVSFLCTNLYKLYNDFFFLGQQGDNGEFTGKIAYDKNKLQTYRDKNEQSADIIMNYFYEQYCCLLSDEDQQTLYATLEQNTQAGLTLIEGCIDQYKTHYQKLLVLLEQYTKQGSYPHQFFQDSQNCLAGFRDITLTSCQS